MPCEKTRPPQRSTAAAHLGGDAHTGRFNAPRALSETERSRNQETQREYEGELEKLIVESEGKERKAKRGRRDGESRV